jgi:osmotically-inducible protein OsmY
MVVLTAALTLACGSPDDTEEMVRGALEQANLRTVDVDLDDAAHTVRLTGTVDTLSDRARAEEVAAAVVGTTGEVQNDIVVAGLGR